MGLWSLRCFRPPDDRCDPFIRVVRQPCQASGPLHQHRGYIPISSSPLLDRALGDVDRRSEDVERFEPGYERGVDCLLNPHDGGGKRSIHCLSLDMSAPLHIVAKTVRVVTIW